MTDVETVEDPLTRLLWCAQCERNARKQNNPKLRSRLSGVDQYGNLRYRVVSKNSMQP